MLQRRSKRKSSDSRWGLLFVMCLLGSHILWAQALNGQVIDDSTSTPLPSVSVLLLDSTGTVMAYAISDAKGHFSLTLPDHLPSSARLQASFIGYETMEVPVSKLPSPLVLRLRPSAFTLDEVVIRDAPVERRGDTLVYDVESFAKAQDRTLADVLRRMPGIEVRDDGRILYQGEAIKKFYIEGDDFLGGRYGIATQALQNKDVDKVEIYEKHQPLRMLQGVAEGEGAALNVKLKEDAKMRVRGNAEAVAGLPAKAYGGVANSLSVNKEWKLLGSAHYNTLGDQLARYLIDHTADVLTQVERQLEQQGYFNKLSLRFPTPSANVLPPAYYPQNESGLLTLNLSHAVNKQAAWRGNIYAWRHTDRQNYRATYSYFLPADTLRQQEWQQLRQNQNRLFASVSYQDNATDHFLSNYLQFEYGAEAGTGYLQAEVPVQQQKVFREKLHVNNTLRGSKLINGGVWELQHRLQLHGCSEQLQVLPGIYAALLNRGESFEQLTQDWRSDYAQSDLNLKREWRRKAWQLASQASYEVEYAAAHSDMYAEARRIDSAAFRNAFTFFKQQGGLALILQRHYGRWRFQTTFPLSYAGGWYHNRLLDAQAVDMSFWLFNPKLRLSYEWGNWSVLLSWRREQEMTGLWQLPKAYVLTDYRTLTANNVEVQLLERRNTTLRLTHSWLSKGLFFHLSASQEQQYSPFLSKIVFENGLLRTEQQAFDNQSEHYMLNYGLDKRWNLWDLLLGVDLNYTHARGWIWQQSAPQAVRRQIWQYGIQLQLSPLAWLDIDATAQYTQNSVYDAKSAQALGKPIRSVSMASKLQVKAGKWALQLTNRYYYLQTEQSYDFLQTDGRLQYSLAKWDLFFNCLNLWNETQWVEQSVEQNRFLQAVYILRPRTVTVGMRFNF